LKDGRIRMVVNLGHLTSVVACIEKDPGWDGIKEAAASMAAY
jgi:hypothetical protein